MQNIALDTLAHVTGGASKSSELASTLSAISSSVNDLKYSQNNSSGSSNLLLPIALLAMNRRQQGSTVVSAGGATVVQG